MTTRRQILKAALLGTAAACAGAKAPVKEHDDDVASAEAAKGAKAEKAGKAMKLLILGGTGFLGPHVVEIGKARGHTVTLFNRGKTHPELFPDLEKLRGDRDGKLDALKGRKWDAVIDTSGYVPRIVKQSADLLAPNVGQYLFVSSISVYPDDVKPHANESTEVQKLADPTVEKVTPQTYGGLKALCEQTVEAAMPGRATTVRPGLIVGPGDPTDRYTYWPVRIDKGGDVVAPNNGEDPAQIVDVRDLAAFMIRALEEKFTGTYNATGPAQEWTMKGLIESCQKAAEKKANLVWIPEKFLLAQKVEPWQDLPVWTGQEGIGIAQLDCRKAISKGLTFRSGDETARDTLAWYKTLPEKRRETMRAGLTPEREQAVLAAWKASSAR